MCNFSLWSFPSGLLFSTLWSVFLLRQSDSTGSNEREVRRECCQANERLHSFSCTHGHAWYAHTHVLTGRCNNDINGSRLPFLRRAKQNWNRTFLDIHNSNCVILWHRGCQRKQFATWITSRRLRRARHAKLKASALLYRAAAAGPPCICLFSAANWFLRHHSDSSGEAGDLKVLTLWKACTHVISLWNSARQLANSRGSEKQGCSGWKFLWTQTTKNTHTEVHVAFWSQLLFGSTVDLAYFAVWCFFNALPGREEFPTTN